MPAGLNPLRDDGVATVRFQNRASSTVVAEQMILHPAALTLAINSFSGRVTTAGLISSTIAHVAASNGPARGASDGRRRINAELEIVRLEPFPPRVLARIAWHRHLVREKIEIERLVARCRAELLDLRPNLLAAQHAGRQGVEPAAFRHLLRHAARVQPDAPRGHPQLGSFDRERAKDDAGGADELADRAVNRPGIYDLLMRACVNGEERSRGNFKDMYWSFGDILARASESVTLLPGDVIGSGTVGTGCLLEITKAKGPWLQEGDRVELEIERIGVLSNVVGKKGT